jgi:hypothetical protein
MTEPRRLIEDGTEFERSALASARLDVASDDGLKRVLVAMRRELRATGTPFRALRASAPPTEARLRALGTPFRAKNAARFLTKPQCPTAVSRVAEPGGAFSFEAGANQ